MLKRILLSTILALGCMVAAPSIASADDDVETMFYDFSDMLIDGDFRRPQGMGTTVRQQARFESLLNLRRSFIDEIGVAAQEEPLR